MEADLVKVNPNNPECARVVKVVDECSKEFVNPIYRLEDSYVAWTYNNGKDKKTHF